MGATPDPAELLARHLPVLRYDSQEPYFADAASEWTDNSVNVLRRADGTTLAAATPTGGELQLSLSFLGPTRYANGEAVSADDRIADPSHDYVAQAAALHARPEYANRVYGHVANGGDGRTWLAYWFFYFYNDYSLIGPLIKAGLHEGDWEMIQLRLDPAGQQPDLAVYAQHKHAGLRPWSAVEREGDQPVVYPARGSHASYFSAGIRLDRAVVRLRRWPSTRAAADSAHDLRYAGRRRRALWTGYWGGTEPPQDDPNPLDDASPRGPGAHAQFREPDALVQTAADHAAALSAGPPRPTLHIAPTIEVAPDGEDLRLAYDTHVPNPAGLVVTIGDPGGPHPQQIHRIPVQSPSGSTTIVGAASTRPMAVRVSVATCDGAATPSASTLLAPRPGGEQATAS